VELGAPAAALSQECRAYQASYRFGLAGGDGATLVGGGAGGVVEAPSPPTVGGTLGLTVLLIGSCVID
jgi:hypothetical protein